MTCPRTCSDTDRRRRRGAALLPLTLALAACAPKGPPTLSDDRAGLPPSRFDQSQEGVDPMLVGHRLMDEGEFELALDAYKRAIPKYGLSADVLSALGSANMRLGRLNQAEIFLRQAVDLDPDFVPAWNNLGVVLITRRNYPEAPEVFRLAYALDSGGSVEIRDNLRLAEQKMASLGGPDVDDANFRLVRQGNGRYLLLGNQ